MVNITFPNTDLIGVKFLGFDGRCNASLDQPWEDIPDVSELRDKKEYLYKLIPGLTVYPGDMVVVSCATGFQVAVVSQVNAIAPKSMKNNKWAYAISKVDLDSYRAEIQKQKQLKVLKEQIESKREALEKSAVYELLAAKDESFAAMLKMFKELGGSFD